MNTQEIKTRLKISQVLKYYGTKSANNNDNGSWWCPIHEIGGKANGHRTPSLVAKDNVGTATCLSQGCFKSDDIFGVIAIMEGLDIKSQFPDVIKKASEIAGISLTKSFIKNKSDKKLNRIPQLKTLQKTHHEYLKNRGIKNIDEIVEYYKLNSWKSYITTELQEDISKRSIKFIPIDKKLKPFCRGEIRTGQLYKSHIQYNSGKFINIFIVAGEKDTWRVHDSIISELKTNNNKNFLLSFIIISSTTGEGNIPKDFFDTFKNQKINNIYICYDNDETGINGSYKVYKLAKSVLPQTKVSILQFEDKHPKGYDLTDFLNQNNTFSDIFTKLKIFEPVIKDNSQIEKLPEGRYFKNNDIFFLAGDISGEAPTIEWIVDNFLPYETVGMIAATGGTGKSWLLMQLAFCVSCGINFMNMKTNGPNRTLLLLGEESKSDVHRRLNAIKSHYRKEIETKKEYLNKNLQFLCVNGKKAILNKKSILYNELLEYIKKNKPKLLIFDPVIRFFDGDENNSRDATRFIELLEDIKNQGMTVLFAHHTSKYGAGNIDQHSSRGSSAFVDGARWQFFLKRLPKNKQYVFEDENEIIVREDRWKYVLAEITKCNGFMPLNYEYSFERLQNGVFQLVSNLIPINKGVI